MEEIDLQLALKKYFGFSDFKGLQEPVIKSISSDQNTFVIMPTGGGNHYVTSCRHLLRKEQL